MFTEEFNYESPFAVKYSYEEVNDRFFIVLSKIEKGRVVETERSYFGNNRNDCISFLRTLYENKVTPVHLNSVIEDSLIKN